MKCKQVPVLIVGGGPAGITMALTLAARGIHYIIVDNEKTARPKPGEAIPPNALPLFKQLGFDQLLNNPGHTRYYGNKTVWGNNRPEEKMFLFEPNSVGYLLNRQLFETQLRELSLNSNSSSWLVGNLQSVKIVNEKALVTIHSGSETVEISADYVVDATGKKASVCRQLGISRQETDQLAALTFHCKISAKIQSCVYIESFENGWIYLAPCGNNKISVMIFTDIDMIPLQADRKNFITEVLKGTGFLKSLIVDLPEADQIQNLSIRPANTVCLQLPYGANWIAIGDAAYSFDPISSYGITSAIAAGYYGGNALADALEHKPEALEVYRYIMENAFQAYLQRLQHYYNLEKRWPQNVFWKRRHKKIFEPEQNIQIDKA